MEFLKIEMTALLYAKLAHFCYSYKHRVVAMDIVLFNISGIKKIHRPSLVISES